MTSKAPSGVAVLAGFLLGSTVTLALSFAVTKLRKRPAEKEEDSTQIMPSALREEQLSRHTLYFGSEGMQKLKSASIVVVGLGGVGSHAAHMLARAGISRLRLVDFDQVTLSSLNRHACATLADVGTPKATCLATFLRKICPDPNYLTLEPIVQMYTVDTQDLLEGADVVIDAIDDVPTKAALLAHCISKKIRVISCMGAGGKSDVSRLHMADLKTASRDPLASKLRQHLKRLFDNDSYLSAMDQLAIVYSSEKTVMKLADFTEEQKADGVHEYGAVDGMRIRVLPVLGTMPAVMGMACASLALCEVGDKPFTPVAGERVGRNVRNKLYQRFKNRERKIEDAVKDVPGENASDGGRVVNGQWIGPIQIDDYDVEYLLEVWRNRCAVTGDRLGTYLELVRWDMSRPSNCQNIVVMGANALKRYDAQGKSSIPQHVQLDIEARLASCRTDAYGC